MCAAVAERPVPIRIHVRDQKKRQLHSLRLLAWLKDKFPSEIPSENLDRTQCVLEVAPGCSLRATAWGHHIFVESADLEYYRHGWDTWFPSGRTHTVEEPFIAARVVSDQAYAKKVACQKGWGSETDSYETDYYSRDRVTKKIPYAYLKIEVTAEGAEPLVAEFKFKHPDWGVATLVGPEDDRVKVVTDFFGMHHTWMEHLDYRNTGFGYHRRVNPLDTLYHHLSKSECPDGKDAWWEAFFRYNRVSDRDLDTRGVKAVLNLKAIKPVIERLQKEAPLDWEFLRWLFNGRTQNKIKVNSLLATMLREVGEDYGKLLQALQEAREMAPTTSSDWGHENSLRDMWLESKRAIAKSLPGARGKLQEEEAKRDFTKRKTAKGQADGLGVTAEMYPRLRKAIENGDIPISVFNNPDKNPVNREFPIWEKALGKKGWAEDIHRIAQDAARRSTYTKEITPYLAFLLFKIPKYMRRHTGKHWSVMPKYVESQWELEMDDDAKEGTSKRRSAFTPVADNENRVLTVPYVAVSVTGVRTQWCYSKHYHVFEEGMIDPISEGVVVNDIEEKLNGRDDYGLMFFTLTGTITARGYPTFLIIFERRMKLGPPQVDLWPKEPAKGPGFLQTKRKVETNTFVHFHRVHPCRSKKGVQTPACELVERCYQYMAGNVPAEDVAAQQGDLIFIKHPNDPIAAGAKVEKDPKYSDKGVTFESHGMVPLKDDLKGWATQVTDGRLMTPQVRLFISTAKTPKNRLGFLHMPGMWAVRHPEHDDISKMEPGWWEIRRCRSYENNPVSIWSLTID